MTTQAIVTFKEPFNVEAYCKLRRLIALSKFKDDISEITLINNEPKETPVDQSGFYDKDTVRDAFPLSLKGEAQ